MEISTLLVDDDDDVRFLLKLVIEQANGGLTVAGTARNGHEALELLSAMNPTVVVLDQAMPGLTGIETARLLLERRPGLPIILCSAYLDDEMRREAAEAGVSACISRDKVRQIPDLVMAVVAA